MSKPGLTSLLEQFDNAERLYDGTCINAYVSAEPDREARISDKLSMMISLGLGYQRDIVPFQVQQSDGTALHVKIKIEAGRPESIDHLLELAAEAGLLLPVATTKELGLGEDAPPAGAWVWYLRGQLASVAPEFISHEEGTYGWAGFDVIRNPLLASVRAIKMIWLDDVDAEGEDNWKPGSWFEAQFGIKCNTLAQASRRGDVRTRKNDKGTRNLYSLPDVRKRWPEMFD